MPEKDVDFIDAIREYLSSSKTGNEIIVADPERMDEFYQSYELLSSAIDGGKRAFTSHIGRPCKTAGMFRIVGKNITFKDTESLYKLQKLATNFDVYPKTDGTVRMDIIFHHIFKRIKQEDI